MAGACFGGPLFMFDKDTAVQLLSSGEDHTKNEAAGWPYTFTAHVTSNWDTPGHHPNGGYLVTIVLSALEKVLPHPHPLVLSAWFTSGAVAGRAYVKARRIKASGSRSMAEAILYQYVERDGLGKGGQKEGEIEMERLRVTTMFTDLAKPNGLTQELGGENHPRHTLYNTLPPIELCERSSLSASITRSIVSHADPKTAFTKKGDHCERRLYMQFHDGRKPDVKSLALFADGSLPAVMTLNIPEVWVPTIEYTVYFRGIPAPGPLKVFLQSRHLTNGYVEEDFDILDSTDKLVAQSRQLALVLGAKKAAL